MASKKKSKERKHTGCTQIWTNAQKSGEPLIPFDSVSSSQSTVPHGVLDKLQKRVAQLELALAKTKKTAKPKPAKLPDKLQRMIDRNKSIKLDVGCGASKQKGWVGIDIQKLPGVDIVHDIETYPWPLPDNCASDIMLSHVLEHINPVKFGQINFMNELWRVCKMGGMLYIACPYGFNEGFARDPTHAKAVTGQTMWYYDPGHGSGFWRFYHPKPWKIIKCAWAATGTLEVALQKIEVPQSEPSG